MEHASIFTAILKYANLVMPHNNRGFKMKYRNLGNTGLKVSEIGFGCEGLMEKTNDEIKEFADIMEKYEVNCIDFYSPNPNARKGFGKAIKDKT